MKPRRQSLIENVSLPEIIEGGIDDAPGKPEDEGRGQKQAEIIRQNACRVDDSF